MATWQPKNGRGYWGSPTAVSQRTRALTQAQLFHARERRQTRRSS